MDPTPPMPAGKIPGWAKKIVPVLVSIGIIAYYFHDQDWQKIIDACKNANLALAVIAVVLPQLVFWFFETLIFVYHVRWFHGPFRFKQFFWMRGAIYILQLINNVVGGGGTLLYIQRKTAMTWKKLWGIVLFRAGLTLWGVGFVMVPATIAMHLTGNTDKLNMNLHVWWFILIVPGIIWFIENLLFWFRGIDTLGLGKLIVRDRNGEFWTAFATSSIRQWFATIGLVLPPFFLTIIGIYLLNIAFGLNVPFWQFIVVAPLMVLVIDAPVAFAGFGTATVAWETFFRDYAVTDTEIAALAAVSLFYPVARAITRALMGLTAMAPAVREIGALGRAPAEGVEAADG